MKVLITGGAGFIGSHLVEHFQGAAEVRVMDNFRSGLRHNLRGFECELIEASLLDRLAVRKAMLGVDYVFHLAAMVSVPESMLSPVECTDINTKGTLIVLEEAARAGARKLVFSSSAAIYGDNPVVPKCEEMRPEPKSPYAVTKLDGEYYCKMFAETNQLQTACLRYFNVFGPRQDPRSHYAAAVPIFIHHALMGEPITIHGDGEQTRDFVYVKDVVAANAHFALKSQATGVFNVGYGQRMSVNELATLVLRLTGSQSSILHGPGRLGDVKHSQASISRLREAGFAASGNLSEGLGATVEFLKGCHP